MGGSYWSARSRLRRTRLPNIPGGLASGASEVRAEGCDGGSRNYGVQPYGDASIVVIGTLATLIHMTTDALHILEQAIARAGGAKVMLRPDEDAAIMAALKGERPPICSMQAQGLPCACSFRDPTCEHLQRG